MSIVLNVATGNIGSVVAKKLLDIGESVVVINRDANRVKHLADRGATVVTGEIDDEAVLDKAFAGAKAVFWLLPPPVIPNYNEWGLGATKKAVAAVRKNNVARFVYISSVGCQAGEGGGAIYIHHLNETHLMGTLPNVAVIRAGLFMENFLNDIGTIVSHGTAYSPTVGNPYPVPLIATADIGSKAAAWLTNDWQGQRIVGAHGPKSITAAHAYEILGKAIGTPIKAVAVTVEQARGSMLGMGLPEFRVTMLCDMFNAFISGRAFQAEPRTPDTTTPTTLQEWAESTFKPAVDAARARQAAQQK